MNQKRFKLTASLSGGNSSPLMEVIKKIVLLLGSVGIVSLLWYLGLQTLYARLLVFISNVILGLVSNTTHLAVEAENGKELIRVFTTIDGQQANYPQELATLLFPAIIAISWCVFVLLTSGAKKALGTLRWSFLPFFAVHLTFLFLLTGYHTSDIAHFLYSVLMENLFVFALILVILDHVRSPVFKLSPVD